MHDKFSGGGFGRLEAAVRFPGMIIYQVHTNWDWSPRLMVLLLYTQYDRHVDVQESDYATSSLDSAYWLLNSS